VTWLSESVADNFWKPFYLAWLLGLWLGPAYVIGRTLAASTGAPWLQSAVPLFVAWALYPISQLSSLSALSVWTPLHPQVLARLAQKPAAVAGFFALTLPVFALGGQAFKWAFLTEDEWSLLCLGAPLLVLSVFLYARLLGRLAFVLMFTRDLFKRRKKKAQKATVRAERTDDSPESEVEVAEEESARPAPLQPSEMAPISTPEGELAGYNILIADDPPAPKKRLMAEVVEEEPPAGSLEEPQPGPARPHVNRSLDPARVWTDEDDDATPYGVNPSEVRYDERVPAAVLKPKAEEMALLDRRDAVKPPKRAWTPEVFAFLFQSGTVSALVVASAIGVCAGVMVRVARMFNPVAGGE
jgi:hypothetical protein